MTYVFGKESKRISKREWAELMNTGSELITRINPDMKGSESINYTIDENKAVAFIDEFLDEYNTYNNRYFRGHNGSLVHVTKGNYGNKLDIKREENWFKEFVNSGLDYATRTPVYIIEAKHREKNDFGDTFIEVSLDEQYMWYYVDGEIYVETPITSGSYAHGGTDPRVVYVYTKIPNKWLTGPTWHSFVKYWVAIQGAIGIHDASWRSVYGGDEYKYNGSHGCINTPAEAMKKIYDKVEIGTPVIVYSIEKNGVEEK
ncbi:MAG: L,D-transpeptidase family protein [Lachnospiraceae bacterium]|nr:L,D-transpeptidase family protein [Lachnospiraceae bacterium]